MRRNALCVLVAAAVCLRVSPAYVRVTLVGVLESAGVSREEATARVASLTEEEVVSLARGVSGQPAGGYGLPILEALVYLVLIAAAVALVVVLLVRDWPRVRLEAYKEEREQERLRHEQEQLERQREPKP